MISNQNKKSLFGKSLNFQWSMLKQLRNLKTTGEFMNIFYKKLF